eukprot:evm.model.scf_39.2 EVM.evm.TU.scf_39.2   scf_39:1414-3353(-)
MPTWYNMDVDLKNVVTSNAVENTTKKAEARKTAKVLLEVELKTSKNGVASGNNVCMPLQSSISASCILLVPEGRGSLLETLAPSCSERQDLAKCLGRSDPIRAIQRSPQARPTSSICSHSCLCWPRSQGCGHGSRRQSKWACGVLASAIPAHAECPNSEQIVCIPVFHLKQKLHLDYWQALHFNVQMSIATNVGHYAV